MTELKNKNEVKSKVGFFGFNFSLDKPHTLF